MIEFCVSEITVNKFAMTKFAVGEYGAFCANLFKRAKFEFEV